MSGLVPNPADAEHSDITLQDRDGRLAVYGDTSVFPASFIGSITDLSGRVQHVGTNPGFLAFRSDSPNLPGDYGVLPGSSVLSFSIRSFEFGGSRPGNLWHWDGEDRDGDGDYLDDVSFAPIDPNTSDTVFRVYTGSANSPWQVSGHAEGDDSDQPGFDIEATGSFGNLHEHPAFAVLAPGDAPPELGIYVASFALRMEGLLDADPVYIALRTSGAEPAALTAADAWLNDLLTIPTTPGDFDGDGVLGPDDYASWVQNYGTTGVDLPADGNGDGAVNAADYTVWRDAAPAAPPAAASGQAVPEPTAAWTLLVGVMLLAVAARRVEAQRLTRWGALIVTASAASAACPVRADHVDMMLYQQDGQLRLGGYSFGFFEPTVGQNVFPESLRTNPSLPGIAFVNGPGWSAIPANQVDRLPVGSGVLPAGAALSFDVLPSAVSGRNLSHWDGSSPIAFGPPPAGEVAVYGGMLFGPQVVLDGAVQPVAGFEFATAEPSGYVHMHLDFTIYGDASRQATSPDAPSPGVYLIELAPRVAGVSGDSPSAHVLLGLGVDDTTLATAEQWLSAQLVPEPAGVFAVIAGLSAFAFRRA